MESSVILTEVICGMTELILERTELTFKSTEFIFKLTEVTIGFLLLIFKKFDLISN